MDTQQLVILLVGVILLGMFTFLPQWQTRRRRQKQLAEMQIGNKVMTIGGIIGTLTCVDSERQRARVEIAPGVEIHIALDGISHTLTSSSDAVE